MIEIADGIFISEDELVFRASRSSGPGGQNVNKLSTRITLYFNVADFAGLDEVQKQQVLKALSTRADKDGVIRINSQKYRSQKANRQAAIERLRELLISALTVKSPRKKTKVPAKAHERRLKEKRRRSLIKQNRAEKYKTED